MSCFAFCHGVVMLNLQMFSFLFLFFKNPSLKAGRIILCKYAGFMLVFYLFLCLFLVSLAYFRHIHDMVDYLH